MRRVRLLATLAAVFAHGASAQSSIPAKLSDAEFWFLSSSLSESADFFPSENYVSNELQMQNVIPRFASLSSAAREVYVGVGPEQNYTYIAAVQPKVAFILDIRRGNLLEHLLYKALFELSEDRAEFLARLLGKAVPAHVNRASAITDIADSLWNTPSDTALFRRNRAEVFDVLLRRHALPLSPADTAQLTTIYQMFFRGGFDVTYSYPRPNSRNDATLYDLVTASDSAGAQRGFLANDAAFRFVKDMHARNMIVPIVGDFAGPTALREVGAWVRDHRATVGAFYVSNVEQYLFRDRKANAFYANVQALPADSTSLFVRSIPNNMFTVVVRRVTPPRQYYAYDSTLIVNGGRRMAIQGDLLLAKQDLTPGFRSMTSRMSEILSALQNGRLWDYDDLLGLSR
jgi:hypothetical protein